jgi:hypothetical protein
MVKLQSVVSPLYVVAQSLVTAAGDKWTTSLIVDNVDGGEIDFPSLSLAAGEQYQMGWVWDTEAVCFYITPLAANSNSSGSVVCYSSSGPFPQQPVKLTKLGLVVPSPPPAWEDVVTIDVLSMNYTCPQECEEGFGMDCSCATPSALRNYTVTGGAVHETCINGEWYTASLFADTGITIDDSITVHGHVRIGNSTTMPLNTTLISTGPIEVSGLLYVIIDTVPENNSTYTLFRGNPIFGGFSNATLIRKDGEEDCLHLSYKVVQNVQTINITFTRSGSCHDDADRKVLIGLIVTSGLVVLLAIAFGVIIYFHKRKNVKRLEIFFWKLE